MVVRGSPARPVSPRRWSQHSIGAIGSVLGQGWTHLQKKIYVLSVASIGLLRVISMFQIYLVRRLRDLLSSDIMAKALPCFWKLLKVTGVVLLGVMILEVTYFVGRVQAIAQIQFFLDGRVLGSSGRGLEF